MNCSVVPVTRVVKLKGFVVYRTERRGKGPTGKSKRKRRGRSRGREEVRPCEISSQDPSGSEVSKGTTGVRYKTEVYGKKKTLP